MFLKVSFQANMFASYDLFYFFATEMLAQPSTSASTSAKEPIFVNVEIAGNYILMYNIFFIV